MTLSADQLEAISIITNNTGNRDYAKAIRTDDNYAIAEIARVGSTYLDAAQRASADLALWRRVLTPSQGDS